jgi:hypothetical protein
MSFIGTNFEFNNQNSSDFGISLVHIETDFLKNNFGVQKTINSEKIRYKDMPILYNVERNSYTISITIAKINPNDMTWSLEDRLAISQWLFVDDNQFHDFVSEDYPDLVFSLQFISGNFNDNYLNQGYVELEAQTQYPYLHTRPSILEYDLTDNTTTTIIEIENPSNIIDYYYPIFEFTVSNGTTLKIKNLTVGGEETIFNNNLTINEVLSVDNANQRIISNTGDERISDFNFVFLRLIKGINRLEITGQGTLLLKTCFPIMI